MKQQSGQNGAGQAKKSRFPKKIRKTARIKQKSWGLLRIVGQAVERKISKFHSQITSGLDGSTMFNG